MLVVKQYLGKSMDGLNIDICKKSHIFFFVTLICHNSILFCQVQINAKSNFSVENFLIENYDANIHSFSCDSEIDGSNIWGEHWISKGHIIFHNNSNKLRDGDDNKSKYHHSIAVVSMNSDHQDLLFEVHAPYQQLRMAHYNDKSSCVLLLFSGGLISIYDTSENKLWDFDIGIQIVSSAGFDDNYIVYGLIVDENYETPCFIEISFQGEILRKTVLSDFKRQRCHTNESESIFSFNDGVMWFNIFDHSLYELNEELVPKKSCEIAINDLITFEEICDPMIFSSMYRNKFPNRSYINNEIGIIGHNGVICFIYDGEQYYSIFHLDNHHTSTVKNNIAFRNKDKRKMIPLRISSDGRISMELTNSITEYYLPENDPLYVLSNPTILYIK